MYIRMCIYTYIHMYIYTSMCTPANNTFCQHHEPVCVRALLPRFRTSESKSTLPLLSLHARKTQVKTRHENLPLVSK